MSLTSAPPSARRAGVAPAPGGSRAWLWPLLIAGAVLLAYLNSFPGAFYFDDDGAILQNPSIRRLTAWRDVLWPPLAAGIGGRPFANLTYALNYALHGYRPGGYHAFSLALHAGAALMLFGIVRRTLLLPRLAGRFAAVAAPLAAAAALLWALHPLHPNVVDYLSQRTEGLMGFLYLTTLYAFIRSATGGRDGWFAVAVVAAVLGMASKEGMVTAPVLILLYDRTFIAGSFGAALRARGARHATLAATWLVLAGLMINSSPAERGVGFGLGQSAYGYALTEWQAVVRYVRLSWWPHSLVFDYGPTYLHTLREALPSGLALLGLLGGTLVALWRAPMAGFAAAWFFLTLAPSSSFIPIVQQPCAENRVYLPLAGVATLLAAAACRHAGSRSLPALFVAAGALGLATHARNPAFQGEIAIWSDTLARVPKNPRAENNLGNALLKADRVADAVPHFEAAIRLWPEYADAHNNLGVTLLRRGRLDDALREFDAAIALKRDYADGYYNRGEALINLGRPGEAIAALRTSLALDPRNAKACNNLGIALLDTGFVEESIAVERRAIELNPALPESHYNLANSLARAGQSAAALAEYDEALRLKPAFARAHNNAGVILLQQGRAEAARLRFEAALAIDPDYAAARQNLAIAGPR